MMTTRNGLGKLPVKEYAIDATATMRAIVYSWSSCSFCRQAKDWLTSHGIAYREVVLTDKEELRRLQAVFGALTMPLVLLDGERLAGLDALQAALGDETSG